jgi:RNA recognition motif-containing protein
MNQLYEDEKIVSLHHSHLLLSRLNFVQSESEMRTAYEKAVSICGLDVYDGGAIWSRYKEFEYEELDDHLEIGSSLEIIQEGKKRLVNIFRRQLAQPLDENETVLQNLDQSLSQLFVESDVEIINPTSISTAYQTGLELREVRQPFEENINSEQFQNLSLEERVSRWMTYIDFEMKDNQIFRAQRLFERAVLNCSQASHLWINYLYFALHRVKNWTLLDHILQRCLKIQNCQQNIECWKLKFLSIELILQKNEISSGQISLLTSSPHSESFTSCSNQIYQVFQLAMQVKFSNLVHYWIAMKMYCDFFQRYLTHLVTQGSHETDLSLALNNLWNAFDYVEYYLLNYFNEWSEGWLLYVHYRTHCEDHLIENICQSVDGQLGNQTIESKSELVWDRVIQKFPKSYPMWKAYIQWAQLTNREVTFCRKLYKKAFIVLDEKGTGGGGGGVAGGSGMTVPCCGFNPYSQYSILVTDENKIVNPQEELLAQWISYEEENGTVSDVAALLVKWNKHSYDFNRISFGNKLQTDAKGSIVAKSKKRPLPSSNNSSALVQETLPSKKVKAESQLVEVNYSQTVGSASVPAPPISAPATEVEEKKVEEKSLDHSSHLTEATTNHMIFLKNLPFSITEDMLRDFFQECGDISKIELVLSKGGKFKGMAQIDFLSEDAVKKALRFHNTPIQNRPMSIQRFRGEDPSSLGPQSSSDSAFHPTTLFVSKIPKEATDEDLRECFSKGETVETIASKIAIDKRSGASKVDLISFCFSFLIPNRAVG